MESNTLNTSIMKIGIGIPTLNRADLLIPSVEKYIKDFPDTDIFIVDNGNQLNIRDLEKTGKITIIANESNSGVAASWNQLCRLIFKNNDFALILNDDIYLGKKKSEIEKLIDTGNRKNYFMTATPDWCAMLFSKEIYNKVGPFDECFFPAYYEDNSYAYRMKLLFVQHLITPHLNPEVYRVSQTIEKDKSILTSRAKNKQLYIEMWGGLPGRETYKKPFNSKYDINRMVN